MREEISKILTMFEEGKLEKEEAIRLIEVLQEKEQQNDITHDVSKSYLNRVLKIHVDSPDGDDVKVNVPIKFLKAVLKAGSGFTAVMPEKYHQNFDVELLIEALDSEFVGNIVDIETEDGERVLISIE